MSQSRFTCRDTVALLALLATLSVMTIFFWLALHFLTPIDASVSDVYLFSCVLLLIIHLIRRRISARRSACHTAKEATRS